MCLIHVDVLRESACAYEDDISLLLERDSVEGIQELTAFTVSLDGVTGEAFDDLFFLIENDVNDEVDAEDLT